MQMSMKAGIVREKHRSAPQGVFSLIPHFTQRSLSESVKDLPPRTPITHTF